MTNSEARKRLAENCTQDPGAIGRLSEAERAALDAASCGNCGERTAVRRVAERIAAERDPKPSRFPVGQEFAATIACLLAGRMDGQQAVATLTAILERIVREHTDRALAEVERRIASSVSPNFALRHDGSEDPQAAAYVEGLHDAHEIVRAARQEQGR